MPPSLHSAAGRPGYLSEHVTFPADLLDAVSRLEQEHLVSIKPKKGIQVNRVSMNSIKELFDCTENRYDFHIMASSFWLNTALVLFLSAVVFQYTNFKAVYLLALLIISGLFLIKVYKDFIFKSNRVNLFQFFMYFCTLEILPYAVILKLLLMYGK